MILKSSHPILLVEDSPEDFEITVRAFRRTNMANPILRCVDGEDALDYLHQRGPYSDPTRAPRPAIILLDLNLPGTDGREVLVRDLKPPGPVDHALVPLRFDHHIRRRRWVRVPAQHAGLALPEGLLRLLRRIATGGLANLTHWNNTAAQ